MQIRICLTIAFVLHLIISSAQNPVTNQRLFDTIPFLPEYWPQRVSQFEKEPMATGQIIFLGNSITQIGDWKKLLGDSNVVNRGIAGDITFGILKRLDEVIKRKPSKLFLLIGINDIGKDIPDAVIADNIKKIISRLKLESPLTNIYLQSILPINSEVNGFPQHYDKQSHIISTNKLLKALADSMKIDFVDLFPLFIDSLGRLDRKHTNDGLHLNPNGDGYKIWIGHLRKKGFL
jgi:lysophospholipase L1-like esterase